MNEPAGGIMTGKRRSSILLGVVETAIFIVAVCFLAVGQSLPQVHLNADGLAPRPIEELTAAAITRDYALAWSDLVRSLESGRADVLGEEFVGFAKDRLDRRVAEQKQAGIRVRIVDHGHHLKAIFYSSDGTVMQLVDETQLEIQTFEGNELLNTQNGPHEYMVLMTPGADRWYVRDLEEVPVKLPEGF
jgi:hypothetical protein